jgi:ferredoxin
MEDLIRITVIDRQGKEHSIEAPTDMNLNLMELTKMEGHGVKGECGGMALCATCQVYIESDHELPEQSDAELDMLDQAFFVQDNSRLGCQIYLRPELDGLKVRIAPEQD